jgi:hypothetical protein
MPIPYENSYRLACDEFSKLNLEDVAFNSSARLENNTIYIDFLGETFIVKDGGKEIITSSGREVKISEKILLLHYLITADGAPLQREEITLENIPGASFYYPTYKARTIDLIINKFAQATSPPEADLSKAQGSGEKTTSDKFIASAKNMGFNLVKEGELNRLRSLVLPNVLISFVFWSSVANPEVTPDLASGGAGDLSNLKILYDKNITHYLPLEDIIILTELVSHRIIKSGEPG